MTKKQQKTLRLVRQFIPSWIDDWEKVARDDAQIGIAHVIQDSHGIAASAAYFLKTERGIMPERVKNKKALRKLLWGHRWMATHVKMWKEGIAEGTLFAFELKPSWRALL